MSTVIENARDLDYLLADAVQDNAEAGVFRCRRDIFTNEDLFALEMKYIFERNWVYLAHESQIPENNDYYTTWIGRKPIVITRDKTSKLNAFVNACAHKGAKAIISRAIKAALSPTADENHESFSVKVLPRLPEKLLQ